MVASRTDVDRWIATAKEEGNKFIISVCDTFDYDDYPMYAKDEKELEKKKEEVRNASMQRINEVITINEDGSVYECEHKEKWWNHD